MPPLGNIQKQAQDFIGALTGKQKALLLGAGVVTVAVVIGFASLMGTPDYKPLVTGMEANDAQALGEKLAAKNIPYRIGDRRQKRGSAERQARFESDGRSPPTECRTVVGSASNYSTR